MIKKHPWKFIVGIAIVLLGISFWFASTSSEAANEGVVLKPHVTGNPDATVTLVEYADFQCPACGQFYPVVKQVLETYGADLRYEFRHFPLYSIHAFAVPAAKATEAAGQQGAFFEMHDKLYENQAAWSNVANATPFFIRYAEELNLDMTTFKRHLKSSMIDDSIQSSFNEARDLGLTGTPSFLLNGKVMQFSTIDDFLTQIEIAVQGPDAAAETDMVMPEMTTSGEPEVKFGF